MSDTEEEQTAIESVPFEIWFPDSTRLDLLILKANLEMGRITFDEAVRSGELTPQDAEKIKWEFEQANLLQQSND